MKRLAIAKGARARSSHFASIEQAVDAERPLEIDEATARQHAERRGANGFGADIRVDLCVLGKDHREAHAVDGEAVPLDDLARERRRNA